MCLDADAVIAEGGVIVVPGIIIRFDQFALTFLG